MARGRMVNTKICTNKAVNELSSDTSRLAFTWLIAHLDRDGCVHGDPAVVKSLVFPRRTDVTIKQMGKYISEWLDAGLIEWYEAEEDRWIRYPAFSRNQSGLRYNREPPSCAPTIAADCRKVSGSPPEDIPPKRTEENRREEKRSHGEHVRLTPTEYEKLTEQHGETRIAEYIERLDDYIGSNGKRYKSHYHVIRSWLRKDAADSARASPAIETIPHCAVCDKLLINGKCMNLECSEYRPLGEEEEIEF